jgi:hypothetical protein
MCMRICCNQSENAKVYKRAQMHRLCIHDPQGHEECSSHQLHTDCKFKFKLPFLVTSRKEHAHSPSLNRSGESEHEP